MKIYAMPITTAGNREKAQACRETWLRDVDAYSFYGDREEADVIKATDDESYLSHMAKNQYAYTHAPDGYDAYLLTCDDTVVNVPSLRRQQIVDGSIYGKVLHSYRNDPSLAYCSGGAGVLFTPAALRAFRESGRVIGDGGTIWADVELGLICRDIGISFINMIGVESEGPWIKENATAEFKDMISYHHLTAIEIRGIYERWNHV